LPLVLACAFAVALGLTGLISAAPPMAVGAAAIPFDAGAWVAAVAVVLVLVLAWLVARPAVLGTRAARARRETDLSPSAQATALLAVWCGLAVGVWAFNPFAAAFFVPAAHTWLLLAAPQVRLGRSVALGLVLIPLVPIALAVAVLAGQFGFSLSGTGWMVLLGLAGGWIGAMAWLMWSIGLACVAAALMLAWRTTARTARPGVGPSITVRGPTTYAGPGSLGGTESALRR